MPLGTEQLAHPRGHRESDRAVIHGFEVDPVDRTGRDVIPQVKEWDRPSPSDSAYAAAAST